MSDAGSETLVVADDGTSLPTLDVLTGRGFVTGKSGSGKSNSANVVIEGLLEAGHSLLIVDIDGEYWGLKEHYSVLHAGAGGRCDVTVDAGDAETLVDVALSGHPVILDLSGVLRADDADALLEAVLEHLFRRETQAKQPFLLVVEEIHEFIPQQGRLDDVGELLLQIAKRGRKHGLGLLGLSQRPAAVDKDFITQCNWLVWHKLTWDNDTDVAGRLLGSEAASAITDFEPGEAFLRTDWTDDLLRVRFREKRTYDAGTTPGIDTREPPSLVAVDEAVLARFEDDEPTDESPQANESAGEKPLASTSETQANGEATPAPRGTPTSGESAVDMVVEFAFMLAHLTVRTVEAVVRMLRRAEDRLVAASTEAIGDDRLPIPVRTVVRVVLGVAMLAVLIVFTVA
jgi:hypothetical protein